MSHNQNLLIIFTRTPRMGKVKTRLAEDIGEKAAFDIYNFLLEHSAAVTKDLPVVKEVHYSEEIGEGDIWEEDLFQKKIQQGEDLGIRMQYAFDTGFKNGFKNIIIIGSDLYDLCREDIENAFQQLKDHQYVLGPAEDGGYYLLGMKAMNREIFQNKSWGTSTVFQETIKDLHGKKIAFLEYRNDIDIYADIKDHEVFKQFLQ